MSSRHRRTPRVEDDKLDISIRGDEVEQTRRQLEDQLQNISIHLSNASQEGFVQQHSRHAYAESEASAEEQDISSVEVPRHNPHLVERSFHGHSTSFGDITRMGNSHAAYSFYHTNDDDEDAIHIYGGETMSTPGHHASHVTLSAGLSRKVRAGLSMDQSASGAEYDPERPVEALMGGIVQDMSIFAPSHRSGHRKSRRREPSLHPDGTDPSLQLPIRTQPQPVSPKARPDQLPHSSLGNAINRLGENFSPRRPRSVPQDPNISHKSPGPRPVQRQVPAEDYGNNLQNPKADTYNRIPRSHRLARATPLNVVNEPTADHVEGNQTTQGMPKSRNRAQDTPQRDPLRDIRNQSQTTTARQNQSSTHNRHKTNVISDANNDQQHFHAQTPRGHKVQLPDVTGLTSAMGSPGRVMPEWQHYQFQVENDDAQAQLVESITALQTRLNQLESKNLESRRRIHELEIELDMCKAEVKREKTRVLEREQIIVAQEKEASRRKRALDKVAIQATDDIARYNQVMEDKKSLQKLVTDLQTHIVRLTSELSSQQMLLAELRTLRETDQQAMYRKFRDVNHLKAEVERLTGEVEVLRGLVEEGLKSRREARENSRMSFQSEEVPAQSERGDASNNVNGSSIFAPSEAPSSPRSGSATPKPREQLSLPERTMRTDHATAGTSHLVEHVEDRYMNDEEIEQISEELEARKSERTRSSVSSLSLESGTAKLGQSFQAEGQTGPFDEPRLASPIRTSHPSRQQRVDTDNDNDKSLPATPFPQIRGERLERLFFSAPEHNARTCPRCNHHRRGSLLEATFLHSRRARNNVRDKDEDCHEDNIKESIANEYLVDGELPPQTVLTRIIRRLEDDFTHFRGIFIELSDQYKFIDAASNVAKRKVLAEHLKYIVDEMESKADDIAALYDLLKFRDKEDKGSKRHITELLTNQNGLWSHPRNHRRREDD